MAHETYIVDAVRTPTGRYGGALAGVRPDDLAARAVRALVERSPGLDPERIDDVFFGNANGAGEENRDVARMAVLLAGLPTSVPGATVNRLCGSGMEAAVEANRAIAVGDASICIAGGVESMSRAPWVVLKPETGYARADQTLRLDHARLAAGQPADARRVDGLARRGRGDPRRPLRDLARGPGRVRAAEPPARRRGLGARRLRATRPWRCRRRARARRADPARHLAREAGEAAPGLPRGRHGHGRQRLAAERRRRCAAAGRRGRRGGDRPRAARPHRLARAARRRPAALRDRARWRRPNRALERAGIGWGDLALVELNEAFAAQVARLPVRVARARPRDRERERRRGRARPPDRLLRRPHPDRRWPGSCAGAAAATGSRRCASAWARESRWCWRRLERGDS